MDVFSIGLQLAFAAVFVVVLLRYLRDRSPVNRDLVFVAGAVAGWFGLSTLNTLVPAIGTSVVRLSSNRSLPSGWSVTSCRCEGISCWRRSPGASSR